MNIAIHSFQKAEIFTTIFQHMKAMTECINIIFEKDRLYFQSMDSSRVSIIELSIPSTWFDVYKHSDTESENEAAAKMIGVRVSNLHKILAARDKLQIIQISFSNESSDTLYLNFTGETSSFDKRFEIPLIEIEMELLTIPAMEYQAEMFIPASYFASIVGQLKMFGESMEIECSEEKIILNSTSQESGKMIVEIKIDDITSFAINEGDVINASFALQYLHHICLYHKIAKDIELKLNADSPLRVEYDLGDGAKLIFFLAPKMADS
jgi:proliferating cell nuclear antigen PCNA